MPEGAGMGVALLVGGYCVAWMLAARFIALSIFDADPQDWEWPDRLLAGFLGLLLGSLWPLWIPIAWISRPRKPWRK